MRYLHGRARPRSLSYFGTLSLSTQLKATGFVAAPRPYFLLHQSNTDPPRPDRFIDASLLCGPPHLVHTLPLLHTF